MNKIARKLQIGDLRSKGNSEAVVKEVLRKPDLFSQLIEALDIEDAGVRMRASDAIEKLTLSRPDLLKPYKRKLVCLLESAQQQELRWHLAQIIPRMSLTAREKKRVFSALKLYLEDKSSIVKTFAMQAMADIAVQDKAYRTKVLRIIRAAQKSGTPAMQSRSRKLLKQFG